MAVSIPTHLPQGRQTAIREALIVDPALARRRTQAMIRQEYRSSPHWPALQQALEPVWAAFDTGRTAPVAATSTRVLLDLPLRGWLDDGVAAGDIGVSGRFNRICDQVAEHLAAAGIPARRLRADRPSATDAVNVGTMHAFKGLEYRCVAVIGVRAGAVPHPKALTPVDVDRLQHEADLLAERCLLFVACTRARDALYVSWSGEPSPFLLTEGI
ncbi:3'-5' exonuclease [Streptomyces sp. ZYX-F-203]